MSKYESITSFSVGSVVFLWISIYELLYQNIFIGLILLVIGIIYLSALIKTIKT